MVVNTGQEPASGERTEEKTIDKELLMSKLMDITLRYREAQKNINRLKAKMEGKDCLELIREVNKYTLILYDLYEIALRLMIGNNQREFDRVVDLINNRGRK